MSDDATRVIVVGGGIAGLVIARRVALAGRAVTLIEQSEHLGGQVAGHTVSGVVLDRAAESFATRGGTVAALLDELGLASEIVTPTPSPAWLHRADGTAVPLPATSLLGIPAHPLAADVRRAIGWSGALRAACDRVLPASRGQGATTLGELVTARMGRAVTDGLVNPIVRGVHSRAAADLPVGVAHPSLGELIREHGSLAAAVRQVRASAPAGSQVAGIRGGMQRLAAALEASVRASGVEVRTGAAATDMTTDGVTVAGERLSGRVVVAAPDPASDGRAVTLVTLIVRARALDVAPRGTGLLVSEHAPSVTARALTHMTAKWAWVHDALPQHHVVRLSYDGHPDHVDARADAETLLGVRFESVDDEATVRLFRPVRSSHAADGVLRAGETVSGTGLASVIAHAERTAASLL